MSESETLLAFDDEAIQAGNRAHAIDHDAIDIRVDGLLAAMTLGQQVNEIRGAQQAPIDGLYYAGGDETLGIPPYKMVDGPRGARAGEATAFPVAIARAATFDVDLERRVGMAIGLEVAAKGGNVLLAPTVNLLRHPGWGRAQETYSEDTHLTGAMGCAFIAGAQNHVLTSPKHFAVNNVEFTRFDMSAELSARTLHEVYLPHFKRCVVEAGAASVMSAYNKLQGVYCGEHPELLTNILRDDWGFRGFVESDWFLGTRSTAPALNAGLDIEMPAAYRFTDEKLKAAVDDGELTEETIARAAGRALHQKLAWDLANAATPPEDVVESEAHLDLAREAAEKSIVLLKNENVLPLAAGRIAVVGDLADTANLGDRGSSFVNSSEVITPLLGIRTRHPDCEYFPTDSDFTALAGFDAAVLVVGLTYREEGEYIPTQQQEAEGSDLARGGDRKQLTLPDHQLELIERARAHASKLIVVLEGGSAIDVESWLDQADALLMAWYPGCRGGHAIARVLFGDVCPSGRLPVSFARMDQLPPWDVESLSVEHEFLQGYRFVDSGGHTPAFPFGFGLSYTTFDLENLYIERYDNGFEVNVDVINTGERPGAAVVQLYVAVSESAVERAPRDLRGFGRVELEPGAVKTLRFELMDDDLMYYDESRGWQLEPARYSMEVGFSSREIVLAQSWALDEEFTPV